MERCEQTWKIKTKLLQILENTAFFSYSAGFWLGGHSMDLGDKQIEKWAGLLSVG